MGGAAPGVTAQQLATQGIVNRANRLPVSSPFGLQHCYN